METNTVQTLIDSIKDLSGQTNLDNDKAIRALNFGADDYSRLAVFSSGKWKQDSPNSTGLPRITTTISGSNAKVSLPTELLAIEKVEIQVDGKYQPVDPVDIRDDKSISLETKHDTAGTPLKYDYDSGYLYIYPVSDVSRTLRVTYSRAHPRFTADNLTQATGVVPIDDEYIVLYATKYVMTGTNDPSITGIKNDLAVLKNDIKNAFSKRDMDTKRRLKGLINVIE